MSSPPMSPQLSEMLSQREAPVGLKTRRQIIEHLMQQPHELTSQIQGDLGLLKYTQSHPGLSETLRHLKGVIYEVSTGLLLACGPVIPDDVHDLSEEQLRELLTHHGQRLCFTEIIEGVQFRVYYYQGQWKISTMGMLHPVRGFEGRRSFQDLFMETFESMGLTFEMLEVGKIYLFTLQHPEEPTTVDILHSRLYLMDVLNEEFESIKPMRCLRSDLYSICHSVLYLEGDSVMDFLKEVLTYQPFNVRGFICEFGGYPHRRLRMETESYRRLKDLKGNCPTPELRYLQLWIEGRGLEKEFRSTFPRYEARLKSLERRLHLLVNWITQKRLRRGQGSRSGVQLRDQLVTLQSSLQDVPEYLRGMGSIQLNDLLTTVK